MAAGALAAGALEAVEAEGDQVSKGTRPRCQTMKRTRGSRLGGHCDRSWFGWCCKVAVSVVSE